MDSLIFPPQLLQAVHEHPFPLVFATVSGAHLYGFPSADSDWDLRGVHVLPLPDVLSLKSLRETVEISNDPTVEHMQLYGSEIELDLVTHDIYKFASLLLKRNGYVLEQLLSPLVVETSDAHAALVALAPGVVTRHHAHHYLGFTANQWALLEKEETPRVKPLLYAFRTVLTGIHLMRSGVVEANLEVLNDWAGLPYLSELMAVKRQGREKESLPGSLEFYRAEHEKLVRQLEVARDTSPLPDSVPDGVRAAVSDWVVRVRLGELPCV